MLTKDEMDIPRKLDFAHEVTTRRTFLANLIMVTAGAVGVVSGFCGLRIKSGPKVPLGKKMAAIDNIFEPMGDKQNEAHTRR